MKQITSFIQKTFYPLMDSIILPLNKISYFLTKCAKSNSYIETLGKHADSLHSWIKRSYEEDFKKSFELQVKKAVKHLHLSRPSLAFDITHEPFYGKTRGLYIFNTNKDKKYDGEFRYLTASIITRNKAIPLMALPVRLGEGVSKLTIDLLEYCQTLFKSIGYAVFDRGFYAGELIDYLESKKIKYLIMVPQKKGRIKDYVEKTRTFGKFSHLLTYEKEKSKWRPKTTMVICKDVEDDFYWIFSTNIQFRTRAEYIWHYKRRWQIETNYRVEDEAHIKSKSTNYIVRYFYFLVSLLLHMLWIVHKNLHDYVQFKKYIDIIEEKLLFRHLGIHRAE